MQEGKAPATQGLAGCGELGFSSKSLCGARRGAE